MFFLLVQHPNVLGSEGLFLGIGLLQLELHGLDAAGVGVVHEALEAGVVLSDVERREAKVSLMFIVRQCVVSIFVLLPFKVFAGFVLLVRVSDSTCRRSSSSR